MGHAETEAEAYPQAGQGQVMLDQVALLEGKPWWQSRTIIGSLVALLSAALAGFGIVLDVSALTEAILLITGGIGSLVAIWGRFNATRTLR